MKKIDAEKASELLKDLKHNLFTPEFVSDEEAEMLYHTILHWRGSRVDYEKIAQKLWTYICIIDVEKETYEELADAIGLTDDELPLCRRLER